MSRSYGDDGIDWSHDSFDRLMPSAAAPAPAPAPRFTPNVAAARARPVPAAALGRSGQGHPPPGGFGGAAASSHASAGASRPAGAAAAAGTGTGTSTHFMSRAPAAGAGSSGASHSSLPPQPAWLQRAYDAPNSSPLATHRPASANASAVPARSGVSPHFAGGAARTGSFGSGAQPQQAGSGVRFTAGSHGSSSAGGSFRNGTNQQQSQPQRTGSGSFQSQYGYQPRPSPASGRAAGGPTWSAPKPVTFPPNFNPNAAPAGASLPPAASAAPVSKYRTTFAAPESDVPKGRKRKGPDLGIPLPDYLQSYVHLPRGKLPAGLSEDEKRLLKLERKRLRHHKEGFDKSATASRKEAEQIDLSVYSDHINQEKKGWNSMRIKVSFQLCAADRVAVDTTPRNEGRIVHILSTIQGAAFDRNLSSGTMGTARSRNTDGYGNKGLWTIPLAAYDPLLARLVGLRTEQLEIVIVPVDPGHLRALRGESNKLQTKFESMRGIPPALAANLYPFQREGVEFCVNHDGRALIGDEMGLGKTIQAIAVASYYADDWPLLVVCPSSLRLTWKNELLRWLGISSLRQTDIMEISSDDDGGTMESPDPNEGRISDDEGEKEWSPPPVRAKRGAAAAAAVDDPADGFIEDDEDLDLQRILSETKPKPASSVKLERYVASTSDDSDGEAEADFRPATTAASRRKTRAAAAEDDEDHISESEAEEDEDESSAQEEEEYVPEEEEEEEETVVRKKPAKRRRIVSSSEDEDEAEAEAEADADEAAPPVKTRASAFASAAAGSSARPALSAKQEFQAKLAAQRGVKSEKIPPQPAPPASKRVGNAEDEELQESLRLIAEMEEREAREKRQSTVKSEPGSVAVKSERVSASARVKSEAPAEDDDVVDLCSSTPPAVKSEPVAAPYVSAADLIKPAFSLFDDEIVPVKAQPVVKKEPIPAPRPKQPAPMPAPSPPPASKVAPPAAAAAASTTTVSSATAASSTTTAAASRAPTSFSDPVKPAASSSPASSTGFRPLTKNNIHVILNGKAPLMGPASSQTRVVIISYDLVVKYTLALQRQNFQFIICDESHYVKNATAKRSQALLPLLESAKRVLCLSGTPAMSRPYELYPQINAIRPTVFGSAHQFGTRYCAPTKGFRGKIEYKGAQNLVELHMLLKKYVLIRRLKQDVLTDLRPKTRTVIVTSCHDRRLAENIRAIAHLKQLVAAQVEADASGRPPVPSAASSELSGPKREITLLYADTGVAKLPFIVSYLEDLLASGIKFLVFAHHLTVLDGIEELLRKEKVDYFRIDGATKPSDRQAGVERFQTEPTCRVALLSITAGGTGITLTAASTVVFAELQWTPALLCQAEDRVHRIGQFNPCNIYYIVAHHTLDEILWPMLSSKLEVLGETLNGREDALVVGGVRGDAAKHTPLLFKKATATVEEAVDLTEQDGDEYKEASRSSSALVPARAPAAKGGNNGAPASAPFSGWIGMSSGKPPAPLQVPPPAAPAAAAPAPKPKVSLAGLLGSSGGGTGTGTGGLGAAASVARLLQRDASLDADLHSTQRERRVAEDTREELQRFSLPTQQGERRATTASADAQRPPLDAVIALDDEEDEEDEYASSEEDPDVFDSRAARKQLELSRRRR